MSIVVRIGHVNPPATESSSRPLGASAPRRRGAESRRLPWPDSPSRDTRRRRWTRSRRAGVAVQTVYFTFHTKAECSSRRSGSRAAARIRPKTSSLEIGSPRSSTRRTGLVGSHDRQTVTRLSTRGPLLPAVQAAASVDPDVALAWRGLVDRRRYGMRRVVDGVFARRHELEPAGSRPRAGPAFGLHRAEVYVAHHRSSAAGRSNASRRGGWLTLARALLPATDAEAAWPSR